jgi:YD repeat-containing protein
MKTKLHIGLSVSIIFASLFANAIVDMKNANYSNTWVDIEIPGSGYELKISRTYNSRSLINGIFGFGWCSDFETRLEKTAEGNLKLVECGAGQETFYYPREFSKKDIDKTISSIATRMRESKKFEDRALKQLIEQMASDADLRAQYAADYKVAVPVKEGTQFFANGREVESIVLAKGFYTRTLPDNSSMRFSLEGRISYIYDKNGNFLKFDYDKDSIKEVVDNNGRRLSFKFYSNKKVKSIVGPNGITAEYKFANLDDLASVKNGWGNSYAYEYDDLHNLTKASYPDNTSIVLAYDRKNDWVTSFTDRQKCVESYKYEFSETDPKMHYWATVKKTCGKDIVNESKHEFWFKNRADGQAYMQRVSSTVNGNITDISYHETFGKPVSIRRNNDVSGYEYYANGQVKKKTTNLASFTYNYDTTSKKVASVAVAFLDQKGKVVQNKRTEFKYDGKGNLTYAANSDGQKIKMTYDPRGRIATITDHAKKIVKIDYEERFGKPAIVQRPGLGTIKVSYKANGDIDKVASNEGPTVAMQVASTFNNLLDIISPATAEIYN